MVFEEDLKKTDKKRGGFGWLRKLVLFLCIIASIFIGALVMLGGQSEALQKGIEQYFSVSTGMQTDIEKINYIGFFPRVIVDLEDIVFTNVDYPTEAARIEKLYVSSSFWNVFFTTGKVGALEIKGLHSKPGVWGARALNLRKLVISKDPKTDKGSFVIKGEYGEDVVDLYFEMEASGSGKNPIFKIAEKGRFSFKVGKLVVEGNMAQARGGGIHFLMEKIAAPENLATGAFRLVKNAGGSWELEGEILSSDSKFEANIDIKRDIEGSLYSPVFDVSDLSKDEDLGKLIAIISALLQDPDAPLKNVEFKGRSVSLDVNLNKLLSGEKQFGKARFSLKKHKDRFDVTSVKGLINGGDLSGKLSIDANETPALLNAEFGIRNWGYAGLDESGKLAGSADVYLKVDAEGTKYKDFSQTLKGRAALVGGKGKFESAALNIWGTGLLTSMLPDLSQGNESSMNCMIAVFKIEEGIAKSNTIFMDLEDLTVVGEGEISVAKNNIDITLKPEPKEMALFDVSVPVKVTGPLSKPSVGASSVGLGLKLGELFLGTINPAFWAFSLTDLGLSEDHPCSNFIEETPEKDDKANASSEVSEEETSKEDDTKAINESKGLNE
jgi:uncharacterized protein involved in outer membrane biogenesis